MNATHSESNGEQELIYEARRGDKGAMRKIYLLHVRYLTAVCSRYVPNPEDVRDTLQDSFVAIFGNIGDYEPMENASLRSWMTRIVVNNSLKFLRRSEKMQFIETVDEYADVEEEEGDPDGMPYEEIRRLIGELPAGYRSVFNLHVFERKSHKEIALMLGINENTSASQFHKAKKMLKMKIKQYREEMANERL